jgi:hypothetical protein
MVDDERRDQVKSSLIRIASTDFFEGVNSDSFRKELAQSLRHVVDACQLLAPTGSSSFITRYDTSALGECLSSIDWKRLCDHHDDNVSRRRKRQSKKSSRNVPETTTTTTTTTTTPLEEILSSLQNPYHWPSACVAPIIETLIQALITLRLAQKTNNVYRSQWPPSQQSILETLTTFCHRIPAARVLPATILSSLVFVKVAGTYTHSCQGLNALLSLVKYFVKELESPCDNLLFMKCVLGILQCLDNMDAMHKHRRQHDKNRPSKLPLSSEERPAKRSRSSLTCATVELLHGELSDDDKSRLAMSIANKRKLSPRPPPTPYLKSILTARVDSNVGYAPAEQAGDRLRLRSKCINTFVATCQKSNRAAPSLLRSVLDDMAPSLVGSPSVRLCVLLLVDHQQNNTNGKFGYSQLCQYWWSRIRVHDCSNASLYLLAYAELIVESSYFDSYDTCASAVSPLLDHLRQCCTPEQDPNRRESARPYLRCLTYILSRRGAMLGTLSELKLSSLLARLSVVFDQPSDWIGSNIAPDERERTMQTLQLAGILGVCDDIEATVCEPVVLGLSPDQVAFPPSICIRNAARQIPVVPLSLFSMFSPVNEAPPKPLGAGASVQIPMMEYVNEDILHHLFSFFGYKRIVRMRKVCREWRSVADSNLLWRSAYRSRYGILPDDKLAQSETAPWKDYFMNKWLAEREIGFSRSKNGWKVRLCGFVECTHVLKSRKQLQNHHVTHQATKRKRPVKKKQPNNIQTSKRQCQTK